MVADTISSACTLIIVSWLFLPVCRFSCLPISENLAEIQEFHEIPSQSSSYGYDLYAAKNAIDGNFEENGEVTACSFTIGGDQHTRAWWKLPLTQLCLVEYLLIYFRSSSTYQFTAYVLRSKCGYIQIILTSRISIS